MTSPWAYPAETLTAVRRIVRTRVRRRGPAPPDLRQDWYTRLQRDGLVIVPGFYSPEQCAEARAELARLEQDHAACVRTRSDHRLFGVDRASAPLRRFFEHRQLVAISQAFYGTRSGGGFTLGARMPFAVGNNGSGEGWHRDSLSPQFKTILYLTDVSDDDGPFQLLPRSHRPYDMLADTVLHRLGTRIRLEEAEVLRIQRRRYPRGVSTVTGAAGTLVLVDSSAIHRGKPIARGERIALTNYYFGAPLSPAQERHFSPLLPFVG